MANSNFKPIYKSDYSSQGTLINDVFPMQVQEMINMIKVLEAQTEESKSIIPLVIGWLSANSPPFRKYFLNYSDLVKDLDKCRNLFFQWKTEKKNQYPVELKNELYRLYETWWTAFNDSNAGIRGSVFISRDTRIKDAIQNL